MPMTDSETGQYGDAIEHDERSLTMGELNQLPYWATVCGNCGILYREAIDCPLCSLHADTHRSDAE